MAKRCAAIDIGTVTCRLLIADVGADGAIDEVRREMAICNLGAGVDRTGRLAPESIERVGSAIEGFMAALEESRVPGGAEIPVRAVATSASRDAGNSAEFQERIVRTGLDLAIIPGEREATLSFAGASSAFMGERVVVIDVGGGSTEIIAGEAGSDPERARSFDIGCRRVTERFFRGDPPDAQDLDRARAWIDAEFADYLDDLRMTGFFSGRAVAVAGTATSIVSMREEMRVYDSARVHGATVMRADLDAQLDRLARMTVGQRRQVVGLHPGRASVIVAGLLVLERIMDRAGIDRFTVSERDILHGIILSWNADQSEGH